MNDAAWLSVWIGVLAVGLAAVVALHRHGVATTHARDLLHVGAGVWVFGWPAWSSPVLPIVLVLCAVALTAAIPLASRRLVWAARVQHSVSDHDERWTGLVLYTVSFAVLTILGLTRAPFPAAAALLALSLGDGIGGAVGARFGRRSFSVPGGKKKSLEGSVTVALMAAAGAALASLWFDAAVGAGAIVVLGLVAAAAEAVSPRGSDNLLMPALVWAAAQLVT